MEGVPLETSQNHETSQTQQTSQTLPQTASQPQQDGRKKPRTEAQIEATKLMKENRHASNKKGKLELNEHYNPDNIAIAELWYSNHELAKNERRKKKMTDMENLIATRLDSYHSRLMEDLTKPLSGFLDQYINDNYEDAPIQNETLRENARAKTSKKEQSSVLPIINTSEPSQQHQRKVFNFTQRGAASSSRGGGPSSNTSQQHDWSGFF
jgi:hypothetical protein